MISDGYNPYATPTSGFAATEDLSSVHSFQKRASRASRLGARVIDGTIIVSGGILAWFATDPIASVLLKDLWLANRESWFLPILVGLSFLIWCGANFYFLLNSGQTIGKKAMGIHIVRSDGSKAGPLRTIFLRELPLFFVILWPVGRFAVLVNALSILRMDKKCIHDMLSDTKVIAIDEEKTKTDQSP